jgi:hypothetical protein
MPRSPSAFAGWFSRWLLVGTVLGWSVNDARGQQSGQQLLTNDGDPQAHLMARRSSNATQLLVDNDTAVPQFVEAQLPPNLIVSPLLRPVVEAMLRDSPTFRRQCVRLTNSPSISVSLEQLIVLRAAGAQAVTDVSFDRDARMAAHVKLGSTADREELIAHEFEHIIEQMDGVDLRSLATRGTSGVRFTADLDRFETDRAVATGRQVTEEIRLARRKRM